MFDIKLQCEEQVNYMTLNKNRAEKEQREIRSQLEVRSADVVKKAIKAGGNTYKANPNDPIHYCSNVKDF